MTRRLSVALMSVGGLVLLSVALVLVPHSWWGVLASGWPVLVPVAGGLATLVAGVLLWQRGGVHHEVSAAPTPPNRQVRPLPSWVIPVGVALVGTVTWAAVTWLQDSVPAVGDGVQRAQLRVESIRTGLTIGAAVTGAFALLLAFRRQQLAERTQQATEYDAGEKRVTELYVKAADQLGSDKAPVRLAGLYALERLAHDNPIHRQSIVEVICAYLRMPYTPPDDQPTPPSPPDWATPVVATGDSDKPAVDPREERQVRLAAQRILARHLRPTTPEGQFHPLYWGPKMILDLTEAVLIDLDLTGCHIHNATFTKAHFSGGAWFGEVTFSGGAWFDKATFSGDSRFDKATFSGDAWFDKATFRSGAWFGEATFSGGAWFDKATFSSSSRFDKATFGSGAWFGEVTFGGDAWFGEVTFGGGARFGEATFGGDAWFGEVTFGGGARFGEATFGGDAWFGEVTFGGGARFGEATFSGDARFDRATFGGGTWFDKVAFCGDAWFDRATFSSTASFDGATLGGARYDGPEPIVAE
ncbi:pentapeptide repeat-containing protein [Micromonospora sp. NPDC048894]|uniref:pentapeptide repeat-containing protein n=1 Tax=Micromonospora sp. NPDC048894 TaxID=3155493 RepID=UPI0033D56A14